tara:strand:- start:385 stop:618 length:234 start_codon:yes stop_codon:yes gene_type:complete
MKYGKTDLELDIESTVICREIVQKILDFGVNDLQKIKIIHLLSLELESRENMLDIIETCKRCLDPNKQEQKKLITLE